MKSDGRDRRLESERALGLFACTVAVLGLFLAIVVSAVGRSRGGSMLGPALGAAGAFLLFAVGIWIRRRSRREGVQPLGGKIVLGVVALLVAINGLDLLGSYRSHGEIEWSPAINVALLSAFGIWFRHPQMRETNG